MNRNGNGTYRTKAARRTLYCGPSRVKKSRAWRLILSCDFANKESDDDWGEPNIVMLQQRKIVGSGIWVRVA